MRGWMMARGTAALMALVLASAVPLAAQDEPGALSLREAEALALERSRDLEVARIELWKADQQVREAWSNVYPRVEVSASYLRNIEVPGQFLPAQFFDPDAPEGEQTLVRFGADNNWSAQARLDQPLFKATALIGVGAADRFRELQEEIVRGAAQQTVTRTRRAFYDVLLAKESVRLSEESVRRVRETLDDTRAMNRAGLVGDYDVLRLEVELSNLEAQLERARNAARAARRQLAVELDLPAGDSLQVEGSLATIDPAELRDGDLLGIAPLPDVGAEALVERALERRSDLRQLRLTESLRIAELRAEQSQYLPEVSLFATYNYSAQADGGIAPFGFRDALSATSPQVGLQVSVPIFTGLGRPARVGQKKLEVQKVRTQTELGRDQVAAQVRTLVESAAEALRRAESQRRAVAQAQRGYEIANAQFREGLGSRLELTEAEVALRQSEFNYAQAVYDYLVARAELDAAVGAVEVPGA